jgi:hypothetical protein
VLDNPQLLKKSIKREKKMKQRSAKQWFPCSSKLIFAQERTNSETKTHTRRKAKTETKEYRRTQTEERIKRKTEENQQTRGI